MNVIVSNKQKGIIDNANIDAIKDLNGLFSVDDLVNKFKNYFFSKMILDATSVIDFATRDVLKKLADEIGSDRLIILLPSTPEPPDEFKKLLIELKIYNFSNNIEDIIKFIENPNTYDNAMSTIINSYAGGDNYYVDSSIKDEEEKNSEVDNISNVDNSNVDASSNNNIKHSSLGDIMSSFNIYNENNLDENDVKDNLVEPLNEKAINEENNYDIELEDSQSELNANDDNFVNNSYVFLNKDGFDDTIDYDKPKEKYVIGFKNVTLHAGSTTLIYMLEKEAIKRNKNIVSLEINKNDFKLFRNNKMFSVKEDDLVNMLDSLNEDVVLIDLNDYEDNGICNEIVYLVEPSTIKLNRLMMENKTVFDVLKDKKIVLNKSMLSNTDIPTLEREANIQFYFNIGSVNDRVDNPVIGEFFDKLLNK